MELGGQFSTSHPGKNMHINKSKPNMAGSFFMVTVLFNTMIYNVPLIRTRNLQHRIAFPSVTSM